MKRGKVCSGFNLHTVENHSLQNAHLQNVIEFFDCCHVTDCGQRVERVGFKGAGTRYTFKPSCGTVCIQCEWPAHATLSPPLVLRVSPLSCIAPGDVKTTNGWEAVLQFASSPMCLFFTDRPSFVYHMFFLSVMSTGLSCPSNTTKLDTLDMSFF